MQIHTTSVDGCIITVADGFLSEIFAKIVFENLNPLESGNPSRQRLVTQCNRIPHGGWYR